MKIERALLNWYRKNSRKLPWRSHVNPYRVWISEVMLQQTRSLTVLPYYEKFLKKYPTVQSLSESSEDEVLTLWSGLGYYHRARNLRKTAQILTKQYRGELPQHLKDLLVLPGIGDYTARAILSMGFGKPYAVLDGNVRRVASRVFGLNLSRTKDERILIQNLENMIPKGQARDFNQAWMELGALVCLPRTWLCGECPLSRVCFAFQNQRVQDFPKLPPKRKKEEIFQVMLVIHSYESMVSQGKIKEKVLLVQKKNSKILEGLWEFPNFLLSDPISDLNIDFSFDSPLNSSRNFSSIKRKKLKEIEKSQEDIIQKIQEKISNLSEFSKGLQKQKLEWIGILSHSITYRRFRVYVYRCSWERVCEEFSKKSSKTIEWQKVFRGSRWFDLNSLDSVPHSSLLSKVLCLVQKRS